VNAAAGESDQNIFRLDTKRIGCTVEFNHTYGEACYIEVAFRVDVRHLGTFTTKQCATCDLATLCDSSDDPRSRFRILSMQAEVIEEEQWLGTLDDQIIHVHGNAVDAELIDLSEIGGHLDLGTDTISATHEYRLAVVPLEQLLIEVESEHAGKSTEFTHDSRSMSTTDSSLHHGYGTISGIDIDA